MWVFQNITLHREPTLQVSVPLCRTQCNFIRHFEKHEGWRTVHRKTIAFWGTTRSPAFTMHKFMSENLRVNIWRDNFTSDYLRVNLPSRNLSRIRATYKLSTSSEPSIVKFIENQSEHLSTLTLYHLKKRTTKRSRRALEPSRIPLAFLRGLNNNKKNSMLKNFVFKKISKIEIPKSSKLHRYVHDVRKLYHARYKCNNKRDPKIINVNKIAIPKKAYLLSFFSRH